MFWQSSSPCGQHAQRCCLLCADDSAIFMNNTICSNNTGAQGGCLAANNATSIGLVNVQMQNNYAENGGGVYVSSCTEMVVYNMSMQNNTATINGGGIFQVIAVVLRKSLSFSFSLMSRMVCQSRHCCCRTCPASQGTVEHIKTMLRTHPRSPWVSGHMNSYIWHTNLESWCA